MYYAEDKVSHPTHGACVILDVCDLNMTGEQITYYKLAPCFDKNASVFVPVDNATKIGLRPLMTKTQANSLMDSLAGTDEEWLHDVQAKRKRYRSTFADHTVAGLYDKLSVMSAIIKRKAQKVLGSGDKMMLENIQKKVLSEVAVVLDISMNATIQRAEELVLQQH